MVMSSSLLCGQSGSNLLWKLSSVVKSRTRHVYTMVNIHSLRDAIQYITQPKTHSLLNCMLYLTQHLYDPVCLPSSASHCIQTMERCT